MSPVTLKFMNGSGVYSVASAVPPPSQRSADSSDGDTW